MYSPHLHPPLTLHTIAEQDMVMYDPMAQESYLPYTQSAQNCQIAAPPGTEQVSHSRSHEPEMRPDLSSCPACPGLMVARQPKPRYYLLKQSAQT